MTDFTLTFLEDDTALTLFENHIRFLATRANKYKGGLSYAEDNTIMAWQISNEPRATKTATNAAKGEALTAFFNRIALFIKTVAPNQLVTTGR